jgi:hypothetical protein
MGIDVLLEGPGPLLVRAITAPARLVRSNIGQGALLERDGLRVRGYLLAPCHALGLKWIAAPNTQPLGVYGPLSGLRQRDVIARTQSHVVLGIANAVAKEPATGATLRDLQIGAVANCVASGLGDSCQVFGERITSHVHPQVYAWEIT